MTPTLCCSPPLSPPEPQRPARTPPAPSTPRSPLSSQPGPQHQAHPHRGAEALAGCLSFEFTHEKPQTWPVRWLPFSSCSPRTLCPAAAAPPAQAWLGGAPCADRCRPARCSLGAPSVLPPRLPHVPPHLPRTRPWVARMGPCHPRHRHGQAVRACLSPPHPRPGGHRRPLSPSR